jgi:hypothetical protein
MTLSRFLAALALATTMQAAAPPPLRVLFIGNSLTEANRLPEMVEALAAANGRRIETRTIAYPNYSLEDHWNEGEARREIARGKWTFVILQQGPSSLSESRALLVEYARRFSEEAARVGARAALFMVWPSIARARDFDGVELSYRIAARETGGVLLPAGEAWRRAWNHDADRKLYGPDGFHPSTLGSWLSAIVIVQGLTGKAPGIPPRRGPSEADMKVLLRAAAEAFEPAK